MSETRTAAEGSAYSRAGAVGVEQLDLAVSRGIISANQRDQILAIAPDGRGPEPRAGLNLVTVGYWAGSVAVLFALAWFLIDRWKSLRPAGVLAVALLYALSFALSSMLLRRLGYRIAASLLAVLVVGMAPVVAWSIESLLGVWPDPSMRRDPFTADVIESVRWIPVQLSMALAGLIALRQTRFGLLTLAVVIPMGMSVVSLTPLLFDPELSFALFGWTMLVAGTLMLVAAYVVERRVPLDAEDYAGWLYLSAIGFLFFGLMSVFGQTKTLGHSLPAVMALFVAIGFMLHRRIFMIPAILLFFSWLVFLAREVFATAVGFMVVMLAGGALLLLGTVFAQRRFPHLIRRLGGEGAPRPATPLLGAAYAALFGLAVVLLLVSVPRARGDLADRQRMRNAAFRNQVERQRSVQAAARVRRNRGAETRPEQRP